MAMNQFVKISKHPEVVTPTSGYNQHQRKGYTRGRNKSTAVAAQ